MIHFPSTLNLKHAGATAQPVSRRTDSLNATQKKNPSHQIFLTVEEELHDARRVHSHGQEEDLKLALNMLIDRLGEVSSMLSEAYKTQADLEVQLNVAKSNLQLVISNNEMLEEALKRDSAGNARDVGWRRASAHDQKSTESSGAVEHTTPVSTPTSASAAGSPVIVSSTPGAVQETSRFFKFRFTTGSSSNSAASGSRPGTPQLQNVSDTRSPNVLHLNSPSLPVLPLHMHGSGGREKEKGLEEELEKERQKRKKAEKDKEALEEELESLSQALFEEANKMVATERIKRADTEEELKEAQLEKEALRSALRLLESQNEHIKGSDSSSSSPGIGRPNASSSTFIPSSASEPSLLSSSLAMSRPTHHRRTSSQLALKSTPGSPALTSSPETVHSISTSFSTGSVPLPLPLTPYPRNFDPDAEVEEDDEECAQESTPQVARNRPVSLKLDPDSMLGGGSGSPWADVPSMSGSTAS